MRFCPDFKAPGFRFKATALRTLLGLTLMAALASCASEGARNAEMAAEEANRVAAAQEAARLEQEEARARAAEERAQREREQAELARQQEQREREAAVARARADAEQRRQEEAERREQARLAALAEAAARRQEKLDRISELEQQIAAIRTEISDDEATIELLQEAILVAEELLGALDTEQAKYDETDTTGNTVEPLAKELIAEIEARKDALLSQINSQ